MKSLSLYYIDIINRSEAKKVNLDLHDGEIVSLNQTSTPSILQFTYKTGHKSSIITWDLISNTEFNIVKIPHSH